jgi:hypothetical protein
MLERRKFLRSGGLLGFLAMGATAAPLVVEKIKEVPAPVPVPAPVVTSDPEVLALLEEQAPPTLCLMATYGEIAPPPPPAYNGMYAIGSSSMGQERMRISSDGSTTMLINGKNFVPGTEKQQSVKMVPGPDGELYLNINGQWKKVLTA